MGLDATVAPIFEVAAVRWRPPDPSTVDAVLLTSANAARHGGPALADFLSLPCYAVGESSAAAARAVGFGEVRIGDGDGAAALAAMAAAGVTRVFHPCGSDHVDLDFPGASIERRIVYAAEAAKRLPPQAVAALETGAVALIHSPRAASLFAQLLDESAVPRGRVSIAAISPAAAAAAGGGWQRVAAAPRPRDEALLEIAVQLCQTRAPGSAA